MLPACAMAVPASAVFSAASDAKLVVLLRRYPVTVMIAPTEMFWDIVTLSMPLPGFATVKNSVSFTLGDAGPTVAAPAMTSTPATKPTVTSAVSATDVYVLLFASVKLTVAMLRMTVPSGVGDWAFAGTAVSAATSTATPSTIPIRVKSRCNMVFLLLFTSVVQHGTPRSPLHREQSIPAPSTAHACTARASRAAAPACRPPLLSPLAWRRTSCRRPWSTRPRRPADPHQQSDRRSAIPRERDW